MIRPKKHYPDTISIHNSVYLATDIDPLLDRLDELETGKLKQMAFNITNFAIKQLDKMNILPEGHKKMFPNFETFYDWFFKRDDTLTANDIYNYFSQFQYERTVYPKVGDMVEGKGLLTGNIERGKVECVNITRKNGTGVSIVDIRPVTTPTREEVISKLTDEELKVLGLTR